MREALFPVIAEPLISIEIRRHWYTYLTFILIRFDSLAQQKWYHSESRPLSINYAAPMGFQVSN